MVEYVKRIPTHGNIIKEQQLLASLREAVNQAVKNGYKNNVLMQVDNWEIIISASRKKGQLPVVKHALYRP